MRECSEAVFIHVEVCAVWTLNLKIWWRTGGKQTLTVRLTKNQPKALQTEKGIHSCDHQLSYLGPPKYLGVGTCKNVGRSTRITHLIYLANAAYKYCNMITLLTCERYLRPELCRVGGYLFLAGFCYVTRCA